eukprot:2816783-Pyramimonas_sp.AAC.1
MTAHGVPYEADAFRPDTTTVFSFPMRAPEGAVCRKVRVTHAACNAHALFITCFAGAGRSKRSSISCASNQPQQNQPTQSSYVKNVNTHLLFLCLPVDTRLMDTQLTQSAPPPGHLRAAAAGAVARLPAALVRAQAVHHGEREGGRVGGGGGVGVRALRRGVRHLLPALLGAHVRPGAVPGLRRGRLPRAAGADAAGNEALV